MDLITYALLNKKIKALSEQQAAISEFSVEIVQELPQTGTVGTIYFLPKVDSGTNDAYDEYLYTNNTWEKIGSTEIDLSDYATISYVNSLSPNINDLTQTQGDTLILNCGDSIDPIGDLYPSANGEAY